jgi:pimeloyl-ACP methyl ester carboxylesterase
MSAGAPTLVLVHGAWHGPWCWERVTPLLDEAGVGWTAVDLPTCNPQPNGPATLSDDAATVRAALDATDVPAILVGHSYGGAVITEGGAHPSVRRLVYLAAFMPDVGESVLTIAASAEPNQALVAGIVEQPGGFSTLTDDAVDNLFYQDCDPITQAWARAQCRPMRGGAADPVSVAAWRSVESTFIVTTDDRAVLPALQRAGAARAADVIDLPTSHSPFASQPALLAGQLIGMVRAAN